MPTSLTIQKRDAALVVAGTAVASFLAGCCIGWWVRGPRWYVYTDDEFVSVMTSPASSPREALPKPVVACSPLRLDELLRDVAHNTAGDQLVQETADGSGASSPDAGQLPAPPPDIVTFDANVIDLVNTSSDGPVDEAAAAVGSEDGAAWSDLDLDSHGTVTPTTELVPGNGDDDGNNADDGAAARFEAVVDHATAQGTVAASVMSLASRLSTAAAPATPETPTPPAESLGTREPAPWKP